MRDLEIKVTPTGYYRSRELPDIDEYDTIAPTHKYADVIAKLRRIDRLARAFRKHEGFVPGHSDYLLAVNRALTNTFKTRIAEVEADRDRFRGSWV